MTCQRSYLSRLNHGHQNPMKHELVRVENLYPWCSARWSVRTASSAQVKSIYRFKLDQIRVFDEFAPPENW